MEKGEQVKRYTVRYEIYSEHGCKLDEFERLDQAEAALERWPQASFVIAVDQLGGRSIALCREESPA